MAILILFIAGNTMLSAALRLEQESCDNIAIFDRRNPERATDAGLTTQDERMHKRLAQRDSY
jgi:hypothetical protein